MLLVGYLQQTSNDFKEIYGNECNYLKCPFRAYCGSAEPLQVPQPDGVQPVFSDKIERLVTDISRLTLLEVSELSTALKQRLNLPDAPVMPVGGFAPRAVEDEDDEKPVKAVQTSFTVKLTKYDESQKFALIKVFKNIFEGMNLIQARAFIESCPAVVKSDISKDEAEKLKETFSKVGAEVVIE